MQQACLISLGLVTALVLSACATKSPETLPAPQAPPPMDEKAIVKPAPRKAPDAETPARRPSPPKVTAQPAAEATPPGRPTPSPQPESRELGSLVTEGSVESRENGQWVFVSNKAPAENDPALFEEAIALNRVRAGLKAVGLPDFAQNAKITGGTISMEVPAGSSQESLATAVNTALKADGIQKVRVTVPPGS